VHEAYLRLLRQSALPWQSRAQFLGLAAVMMRRVLVDHGRGRRAGKRGAATCACPLGPEAGSTPPPEADFGDLERALEELALQDARQATSRRAARVRRALLRGRGRGAGRVATTSQRDWRIARAWLFRRLTQHEKERRGLSRR
jgi:hypothetical protein